MSYLKHWREIAGTALEARNTVAVAARETLYMAARDPASHGVTNAYFRAVGELIAPRLR